MVKGECLLFFGYLAIGLSFGLDVMANNSKLPHVNERILDPLHEIQLYVKIVQVKLKQVIENIETEFKQEVQGNVTLSEAGGGVDGTALDQDDSVVTNDVETDAVITKFKEFTLLSGSQINTHMTSKANTKLANDCFKHTPYKDIVNICEAVVYPAFMDKDNGYMTVNNQNVRKYMRKLALEVAKKDTGNSKLDDNSDVVSQVEAILVETVITCKPNILDRASNSTRSDQFSETDVFNRTSKGKAGRVDSERSTGYIGVYKDKNNYTQQAKDVTQTSFFG